MQSRNSRLDRFISQHSEYSRADSRRLIAQKRILLNGEPAFSVQQSVGQFTDVVLDGCRLNANKPVYMMLHKPAGFVSATKDDKHPTVMEFVQHPQRDELHIAGRLDLNTTGLMLLTNDGAWSRHICLPATKLEKTYEVTLSKPLSEEYVQVFADGIYFAYENITTQPAQLEIISPYSARLTLTEGKYHQVKRMFGFFDNEVLSLHRASVGPLQLGNLPQGQTQMLSTEQVKACTSPDFPDRF